MNGINIVFGLSNQGKFDLDITFSDPNEEACQLFGLFLHSLEQEQNLIYAALLKKLRQLLKEDSDLTSIIELVFKYKNLVESTMDSPVMSPSQVFNKSND